MLTAIRPLTTLLLSTFLMTVAVGLTGVLVPLRAVAEGWGPTTIAWIGTCYAVAFTTGCLLIPLFVRRVGHIRVFAALQTCLSSSMLLLALVPDPVAWAAIRSGAGLSIAGGYMVLESWINEGVGNASRGAVLSAYMIISMLGLSVGQFILPFGPIGTATMFMLAALTYGAALLPMVLSTAPSPRAPDRVSLDLRALLHRSPAAVIGSVLSGVIAGNWSYFAPIYGLSVGLSSTQIATMLTGAMIGGMLCQLPLGKLSDRIDRRYVMTIAGTIGVVVSVVMIVLAPRSALGAVLGAFALGSVLYTIYSLNVAHANDEAGPNEFIQVSGGLLIVYGIGNTLGPQLGGRLIERFGPEGFFVGMGMTYTVYGGYSLWRSTRKLALPPALRTDFSAMPAPSMQTPAAAVMDVRAGPTAS